MLILSAQVGNWGRFLGCAGIACLLRERLGLKSGVRGRDDVISVCITPEMGLILGLRRRDLLVWGYIWI